MGNSSQSQTQNSIQGPWFAQAPYLVSGFVDAQNAYKNQQNQGPYQGNYVAPTNADQYNAANTQYNNAMGAGTSANDGILNQGYGNMATGYGIGNNAMGSLGSLAANNNGQNLVNTGQGITNQLNSGVQAQVNSAMQAANQNAAENTIPNLYRSAASTGNLNSDRTALAQGVVDRGLQQTAANMAGSLEAQNTQTGLNSAQNLTNQNASMLGTLGSYGMNLGQSGLNALSTGINNFGTLANQAQTGANTVQALDQSNLNNSIQQYQQDQNFPWQALQNYMGVVGGNNWGSTGTSKTTTTSSPSGLSVAGGILGSLGSLFG